MLLPSGSDGVPNRAFLQEWKETNKSRHDHQLRPTSTIRTTAELVETDLVKAEALAGIEAVAQRYAIAISPAMAALIDRDDPNDPIARQFVPDAAELNATPEERDDPIGDLAHSPVEGIVHRYPDRVLLKAVHVCPVYCRFCFRREMVGPQGLGDLSPEAMEETFGYITDHLEISEVILTGGEPFMISPPASRKSCGGWLLSIT